MKKKIAIIGGNGVIAQATYNGFINYSPTYGPENISLITRNYFDRDDRSDYPKEKLNQFEIIILAVKPKDAITSLSLLSGKLSKDVLFVSTVSGLNIDVIVRMIKVPYNQVVKMTLTINVAYGKGIIVYNTAGHATRDKVENLFYGLYQKIIHRPGKKITSYITGIGSTEAFHAQKVFLLSQKYSGVCFHEFLQTLSIEHEEIKKYLYVMEKTQRKIFDDGSLVEISFVNTLETLKMTCVKPEDIILHIKKVATKGGCTEIGIDKFNSLEKVTEEFLTQVLLKIHKKAKSFKHEINVDFMKYLKLNREPQRIPPQYDYPRTSW